MSLRFSSVSPALCFPKRKHNDNPIAMAVCVVLCSDPRTRSTLFTACTHGCSSQSPRGVHSFPPLHGGWAGRVRNTRVPLWCMNSRGKKQKNQRSSVRQPRVSPTRGPVVRRQLGAGATASLQPRSAPLELFFVNFSRLVRLRTTLSEPPTWEGVWWGSALAYPRPCRLPTTKLPG